MSTTLEASPEVKDKYAKHEAAAGFLGRLADSEFGSQFSEKTISNWGQALRVIFEVDNIFDGRDDEAKARAIIALRSFFGSGGNSASVQEGDLTPETLQEATKLRAMISDKQAQNFVNTGLQVISVSQSMRSVGSPRELARLTMLEGQMTATMLVHLIEPEDREQPGCNDFIRFLRVASRAANVVDSIADLKTDYSEGVSVVKPTLPNRLIMLWECLPAVKRSVDTLGALAVVRKMPQAAWQVIRDRSRTAEQ